MKEAPKNMIQAQDDKGDTYFVPRSDFRINNRDWIGRLIALVGLGLGAGAVVYQATKPPETKLVPTQPSIPVMSGDLIATVEAMQTQDHLNAVGDCVNEDILRGALGSEPVGLEDCSTERIIWEQTPLP